MDKSTVTSVTWVPRGAAKKKPEAYKMTEEDWELIQDMAGVEEGEDLEKKLRLTSEKGLEEFNLENYDNEGNDGTQFLTVMQNDVKAMLKDKHLAPEADSDDEYHQIRDSDLVLVSAQVEEDTCSLEVMVYEEEDCNMYVHHDILLGAYPLCTEWMNTAKGDAGNFLAVGSFHSHIEIWNLDVLNVSTPHAVLGLPKKSKKKKKVVSHDGPVLALSRNLGQAHVLASGSADATVRLWDVNEEKCLETFAHHADKVQCVAWHPAEHAVLMTAAFDKTVAMLDVRQSASAAVKTKLSADAEAAVWSVQNPMQAFVTAENGHVQCLDVRTMSSGSVQTVWTLDAHDTACTGVVDGGVKNMMLTCSLDGTAKVWDLSSGGPKLAFSRDLQAGPLFHCSICPESPTLATFGGNQVVVWDMRDTDVLNTCFNL